MTRKFVRRPRIDLDARGRVAAHGRQLPVRGVWHSTECSDAPLTHDLEAVVNFWHNQGRGYGAHVIVNKYGESAYCLPPDEVCWAVENRNTGTVSIELVGFARFLPRAWFLRPRQLDKLARWMAWLRVEYGIPLEFGVEHGWSRHADQSRVYGGTHWDPGVGFPWRWVLRRARKYRAWGWV